MKMFRIDTCLVVPSNRFESFEKFVKEWSNVGLFDRVTLILVEDNPTKTFEIDESKFANFYHFSWEEIENNLGSRRSAALFNRDNENIIFSKCIPRRSDTIRSFGYYLAAEWGFDYIMTLDDDCYPMKDFEKLDLVHKSMLNDRTKWFNTLNNVRPRGVPYNNIGKSTNYINHGLWTGTIDYDAPQQLVNPVEEFFSYDNKTVPSGVYFPFCGMNVMWRKEVAILSYHLLMGHNSTGEKKYCFDRFGDIWSGIIAKRVCDIVGLNVSTGTPYINHSRASNPFINLKKEANGIHVNESFWEFIDSIELSPEELKRVYGYQEIKNKVFFVYKKIALEMKNFVQFQKEKNNIDYSEYDSYFKELSEAMVIWCQMFAEIK